MNGHRSAMEDEQMVFHSERRSDPSVFAIFDGHSGRGASMFLKHNLARYLERAGGLGSSMDPLKITQACLALDQDFLKGVDHTHGSTACMAFLHESRLLVANIGDSRCLVMDEAGKVKLQTIDHKPNNPIENKRIHAAGGFVVAGRVDGQLALSRAFGDSAFKNSAFRSTVETQKVIAVPEFASCAVQRGDVIVLACDGLYERLTYKAVAKLTMRSVRLGASPTDIATSLIAKSLAHGSQDNISVMVIIVNDTRSCDERHNDGDGDGEDTTPNSEERAPPPVVTVEYGIFGVKDMIGDQSSEYKSAYLNFAKQHNVDDEDIRKVAQKHMKPEMYNSMFNTGTTASHLGVN